MLKISIITPNYNYSKYLPQLFESVIGQDYDNWEQIVVDDGSTDDSVEIINYYAKKSNQRIKLISQSNMGQTKALNRALAEVSGDILCWINSDDYYCPGVFQAISNVFLNTKNINVVYGDIIIVDHNNKYIKTVKYLPFNYASGIYIGFGKLVSSNAIFWKYRLSEKVGDFDDRYNYAMDSEYWSRLLYGQRPTKLNIPLAVFRWHEEAKTMLRRNKNSKHNNLAKIEDRRIAINSFRNLPFSKYIPFRITFPLYIYYKIKRHYLKLINWHYRKGM